MAIFEYEYENTPVSRRAVLCDWVWQAAGGRPRRFPYNNFSSVYRIFTKLGHMVPLLMTTNVQSWWLYPGDVGGGVFGDGVEVSFSFFF
jgi:hypothetical protein